MVLRNFQSGDNKLFLNLVNAAYRNLETLTTERVKRLLSPPYFKPKGFFIAEEKSKPLGCVGVFNLSAKDRVDLRYLAVKNAFSNTAVVNELTEAALNCATSKKCKTLKAVTLTIQPYVEAYQKFGFRPVRRILRISWNPVRTCERRQTNRKVEATEVSEAEVAEALNTNTKLSTDVAK